MIVGRQELLTSSGKFVHHFHLLKLELVVVRLVFALPEK